MDVKACDEEGVEVIKKFGNKMMNNGYTRHKRDQIVGEGLARVKNIQKEVDENNRPLYRTSENKKLERGINKNKKSKSWYGDNDNVLFVQARDCAKITSSFLGVLKTPAIHVIHPSSVWGTPTHPCHHPI